jgi:hypothetical protein
LNAIVRQQQAAAGIVGASNTQAHLRQVGAANVV